MAIEYGLKSFKFKAEGEDTLESLGKIAEGSVKWTGEKASINHFFAAQNPDYPALSLKDKAGLKKVAFNLMEIDADALVRLFGGEATGVAPAKSYVAPRTEADVHGAAELITESGLKITIPKSYLAANFNWDISRKAVSNIEVELIVELPDLDTDMPYTIAREV
jgi:hypothetical protein